MTMSQNANNTEAEISSLFRDALSKLDKIDAQAERERKEIVKNLAKDLEGKIATDTISIEIVNQLRGRVSERHIRECLDEKYKQKHRVENARKQESPESEPVRGRQIKREMEKELLKCETCRKEFVGYKELNNHLSQNKTHKPAPSETLDGIKDHLIGVAREVTELYAYIRQRLADTNNIDGYYLFVASTVITNILDTYIKESEDEKHPDEALKILKESAANFTRDFKDLYAL
jgi:hypothetical protein